MKLIIFENEAIARKMYPITYLRPIFELRCGQTLMREKIERAAGQKMDLALTRDEIAKAYAARSGFKVNDLASINDDVLIVNGRWLFMGKDQLPAAGAETVGTLNGELVYARLNRQTVAKLEKCCPATFLRAAAAAAPAKEVQAKLISWPWELPLVNAEAIRDDFARLGKSGIQGEMSDKAAIWGPADRVYAAKGSIIEPFVCLDTKEGPIIIEEDARINPFTRIEGPAVIGRKALILGAKIREGTTIGPVCRVGGEVEEAIMHAYSNKYHDGFLGHAYVCEWVNLGALTTNSDLKNDYSNVEVYVDGELTDTGSTKVGCCIGDHTKTSIGTLINTGTLVGMMSYIVGAGAILPKSVPSFVMYAKGKFFRQGINTLLGTARTAMGRRKMQMLPEEEELIKHCMEITKEGRNAAIKKTN